MLCINQSCYEQQNECLCVLLSLIIVFCSYSLSLTLCIKKWLRSVMSCSDKKNTPQNVNNQSIKLPLVVIKWLVLIKMWKYIVFSLTMEQIHLYRDRRSDTPKGSNIVHNFEISKQNNPTGLFTHWAIYTVDPLHTELFTHLPTKYTK